MLFYNFFHKYSYPLYTSLTKVLYFPTSNEKLPGQNTGVGSLSLLQGIFLTQGSNPGLPHCRWTLYQLSHKGSPRILEWVAFPFSRDLPNPGVEPVFPALQVDSLPAELSGKPIKGKNTCSKTLFTLSHIKILLSQWFWFITWFPRFIVSLVLKFKNTIPYLITEQ